MSTKYPQLVKALEAPYIDKLICDTELDSYAFVVRGWLPKAKADTLFVKLSKEVAWEERTVKMMGKEFKQSLVNYACGDTDQVKQHKYAGQFAPVHKWIPEVKEINDQIVKETQTDFNACLINYYHTKDSALGYHADKELSSANESVVTISLGGSRDFYMQSTDKIGETIKTTLHSGDVCVMTGNTQKTHKHSIPKRANPEPRISLTLRLLKGN